VVDDLTTSPPEGTAMQLSRTVLTLGASTVALGAVVAVAGVAGVHPPSASATVEPGTPARDVHIGRDDDNARNHLIQPRGVRAKQHMDNADILFGRANDDLLIGRLGSDTLLGGSGSDILVGGPDRGRSPSSDVAVGDTGDDVSIWSPGDGNDAFVANEDRDTMILAPLVRRSDGSLRLTSFAGRKVPHVSIDNRPRFSCTIVRVPRTRPAGFSFLVRFDVDRAPVATVRLKDVERLFCPSPRRGTARVADLTVAHPAFHGVRLRAVAGVTGSILGR
jgi:hypothetical protein